MKDLSEEFRLDRMKSGNPAVYLLKEEFENFLSSPQRVELCDWIARCFRQLEQFHEAGSWYETAGQLILAEPSTPTAVKALCALDEYEKALDCYQRENDEDSISECSTLLRDLRKACMPN